MKFHKHFTAIFTALLFATINPTIVSAEVSAVPDFEMHGNKCGKVIVASDIERNIHVQITMHSPDGNYVYYNTVIPSASNDPVYSFVLEGKDDISYTISFGVAKYKGSDSLQIMSDEIIVYDVDEIVNDTIEGYEYSYTITDGDVLSSILKSETSKNDNNIYTTEKTFYFPISEALKGDANLDGIVNIRDAAAISKALASGKELPLYVDFNDDGKVNVRDAAAIAMKMAGNIQKSINIK